MYLSGLDYAIIFTYFGFVLGVGLWISKLARNNIDQYFLGGNKIKLHLLGLSNASGMFDISGVIWAVTLLFVYVFKSAWIPWLWPVWNQIFLMIFLAVWIRLSNVIRGAFWILPRFSDRGQLFVEKCHNCFRCYRSHLFHCYLEYLNEKNE